MPLRVAPLVGAWIETSPVMGVNTSEDVAPLVGAWIETLVVIPTSLTLTRRTPRGCVD